MPAPEDVRLNIQAAANAARAQFSHESMFRLPSIGMAKLEPGWKEFPHPPWTVPPLQPKLPKAPPAPPVQALPPTLDFQSGQITFRGGTPVGGWSNLRLYQNGNFEFSGHFHVSGAPSYDVGLLWFVVDNEGQAYAFEHKVHLSGTFEAGSRDGDWSDQGNYPLINQRWPLLCAGSHSRCTANVNWDWQTIIKQAKDAIEVAGTIVKDVAVVVAMF